MKKIIIFILSFFIFLLGSCSKKNSNETPEYLYHYDFRTSDDIKNEISNYWVEIKTADSFLTVIENENYTYYSSKSSCVLIDKKANEDQTYDNYYLDHSALTKELSNTLDQCSLLDKVVKYLTAHLVIADSNYEKGSSVVKVAGIDCNVYSYVGQGEDYYYVSVDNGYCLKREITLEGETSGWEITKLSFDINPINIELNSYVNYELIQPYKFYTEWPNTTLSNLIPKFLGGTFISACDNGSECDIIYQSVSKQEIENYVIKIGQYGFVTGYSQTDELQYYNYVGKNNDNVVVTLAYVPTNSYQLSIVVKYATLEEYNELLNKWK